MELTPGLPHATTINRLLPERTSLLQCSPLVNQSWICLAADSGPRSTPSSSVLATCDRMSLTAPSNWSLSIYIYKWMCVCLCLKKKYIHQNVFVCLCVRKQFWQKNLKRPWIWHLLGLWLKLWCLLIIALKSAWSATFKIGYKEFYHSFIILGSTFIL